MADRIRFVAAMIVIVIIGVVLFHGLRLLLTPPEPDPNFKPPAPLHSNG